jgi:tyrosine-protein phosphatase YwqE
MKPESWSQVNSSFFTPGTGMAMKKTQIRTVLEVSIVDLWAAEAFLVTVTPKALKEAIEKQIRTDERMIYQLAPIS